MTVGGWHAARVSDVRIQTAKARSIRLEVSAWPGSIAGQHVDLRLTAEDGYQAVRSYSLASYGPGETIELAVDEVADGEVSPYLVRELRVGDELEVKGPLGQYFVWEPRAAAPTQLIAGGSGIVPLHAMVRAATDAGLGASMRLLYSVRGLEDAIFRDELDGAHAGGVDVSWVFTRRAPAGWGGRTGRVDADVLREATWSADRQPAVFVCGPTGFVEHVSRLLVELGHDPARVRTERFGGK
ncbi:ferredoxin reductase [Microbacterium halophytorum]|uniref:ferredoxin reductase n=1 Tax=Microbacterium halophytorum TaxID=2067568 RepID=UPI000CFBE883|nr:ferredoxin reductase [Microbacterium halophytorum]